MDAGLLLQFVTYRLSDSLPRQVVERELEGLVALPNEERLAARRARLESLLDAGHGACALRVRENAEVVVHAWRHFHGVRYDLIAFVVMPNHVHVLVRQREGMALAGIVQSWKSYTSRRLVGSDGGKPTWARDYWDRWIRNDVHLQAVVDYVHNNPVAAGLVSRPEDWPWSSAAGWG